MSFVLFFFAPVVIGLGAAWFARGHERWVMRIGLAGLLALPALLGWYGSVFAAMGQGSMIAAFWSLIWSSPAWGLGVFAGSYFMRKAL